MRVHSLDGFYAQNRISFLPKVRPSTNPWCLGKTVTIPIQDFYFNVRNITWKNKIICCEYDLLVSIVQYMIKGDTFNQPLSKDESLDLIFEMENTI